MMKWLINNWYKATPFLGLYTVLFTAAFVLPNDFALFLIWLQTAVYFFHQFEEYVLPGGFVAFFNFKTLGSNKPDQPLNTVASFWINVPIIFIAFPLSAYFSGAIAISIGVWTAYFSVINALSHVGMAFKFGYNPGLIVSMFLNIPIGVYAIYYLSSNKLINTEQNLIGLAVGLAVQLSLMIYGFLVLKPKINKD